MSTDQAVALRDQSVRDRITTDTASTLFVNAGAGSGKTRALVDRIATLVLHDGVSMAHIAAVTFTEKAGAELRDRLRSRFQQAWRAEPIDDETQLHRDRAAAALDELDRAAVGTLHSFAQRILTEHAIAAGLPPLVEVMDEVASSVAFEDRWSQILTELLDDESMEPALLLGMAAGLKIDTHIPSLARALGNDWDLIADRILPHPPARVVVPDTSGVRRQAIDVLDLAEHCTDAEDNLFKRFPVLTSATHALRTARDDAAQVAALQQLAGLKFGPRTGNSRNWSCDINEVRAAGTALVEDAQRAIAKVLDRCLRAVTYWTAERVLAAAMERRRDGRLEFHDLLVLTRDLLRHNPEVRAALHRTYQRLLLDEFQDTDPIQIELAVRIAGGEQASEPDWQGVHVPEGRLFVVGDAKQSIYRFRRADINMYLNAQEHLGTAVSLTTNFRTLDPILTWVNHVFSQLISAEEGRQPEYQPLDSYRIQGPPSGPAVTVLGAAGHDADAQPEGKLTAERLRILEADDVAESIRLMLTEGWQVQQGDQWRAVRPADIAVLVPARTSLSYLEAALTHAGVPYRAEASSLVYQAAEIRALMACARAIADFSDELSLVTALRSTLFGCGDDDLWEWRRHGGRFTLRWQSDEQLPEPVRTGPVATGLEALRSLARQARWSTPSQVLEAIVAERRMFEVAATGLDRRDVWRRLRFVVDQARAWSQVTRGGLRSYLAWAAHQGDESSRVSESVLPETDVDAVHISTIHASKGLEYPVVIMSGMTSQPRTNRGLQLLWPAEGGYEVRITSRLQTSDFTDALPVDEQMDTAERMRLLYVGATRARDHLVVSLHRDRGSKSQTAAKVIAAAEGAANAERLEDLPVSQSLALGRVETEVVPAPTWQEWVAARDRARDSANRDAAMVASGLEGTEPTVVLTDADPGSHKAQRDLVLPPWSKGRYGSAIGRAVHGVLQSVDLGAGQVPDAAVDAQCVAEGVTEHQELVAALVKSAVQSEVVREAATRRHWRETYVGTTQEDGTILEGYVDLVYDDGSGGLVIVDYKTDAVPAAAIESRIAYYQPQMQAYATCLSRATGRRVRCVLLFLHPEGAVAREVPVQ
ncbi:UvrD-helicase domain-containing protein [Pseudactinotalea sp. Z1739]|uniref:UvrD-helicase domain-containing protein n=1 Tax=Pseudactinotalea sp. Z1739 TaxID=3413028 RepID=UPI003C7AADD9